MRAIRGNNTCPEVFVRRVLHRQGFRFRLNVKDLPGKPDIVLPKHHAAIFVHGCFWHQHSGCKYAVMPKSNTDFWQKKLESNVARDALNIAKLIALGWKSIVVWECDIKNPEFPNRLSERILGLQPT